MPVLVGIGERYESTHRFIEVEHLISRSVTEVLGSIRRPSSDQVPRVLLAAADEELHTLPLEALAAALAQAGVATRLLGARVPPEALSDAVDAYGSGRGRALVADTLHERSRSVAPPAERRTHPGADRGGRPRLAGRPATGRGDAAREPLGRRPDDHRSRRRSRAVQLNAQVRALSDTRLASGRSITYAFQASSGARLGRRADQGLPCAMMVELPSSSSGPGRRPFKAVARVRIPLGVRQYQ